MVGDEGWSSFVNWHGNEEKCVWGRGGGGGCLEKQGYLLISVSN